MENVYTREMFPVTVDNQSNSCFEKLIHGKNVIFLHGVSAAFNSQTRTICFPELIRSVLVTNVMFRS